MNITRPHPNIVVRTTAHINLSADQWALRTMEHSRCIVDKVADSFNKRLTSDFNQGLDQAALTTSYHTLANYFGIYITDGTARVFADVIHMLYRAPRQ
jgi:hypothetical protein